MSPDSPGNPCTLDYESPADFARRTGLSLSTVRRYIAAGRIPVAQPGGFRGRVLIPQGALPLPAPAVKGQLHLAAKHDRHRGVSQNPTNDADRLSGPRPGWLTKSKNATK
jgi:hypothetical protein